LLIPGSWFTYTDLKIYPNPFSSQTIIKFPNPSNNFYKLIITDLSGKVVKLIPNINNSKIVLNRQNLSKGFYFLELRGPKIYKGKLIIQ